MNIRTVIWTVALSTLLVSAGTVSAQRGGGRGGSGGGAYHGGGNGGGYRGGEGYRGGYGGYRGGYGGYGYGGFGLGVGLGLGYGGYGGYYSPAYGVDYAPSYYGATPGVIYSDPAYSNGTVVPAYTASSSAYAVQSVPSTIPPETVRSSMYTPDMAAPTPASSNALIRVEVPTADAKVWFDTTPMTLQGTDSVFQSPPLEQGKNFSYTIKAQWKGTDGKDVEQSRVLQVQAGQTATANFR